jgi:hypothetical protein
MTQNNLGSVLQTLGERESGTGRLEEAAKAYDAALTVFLSAGAERNVERCRANRDEAMTLIAQRQK